MKLALAIICKGSDDEAIRLDELLDNTSKHIDGIFVTVTQENKKVEEVVAKYNGNLSHFNWCNDFAKARNFNFAQVPKEYTHILWADADDNFRNLKYLKKIIKNNPNVDVFSMNYLYHFNEFKQPDVVHMKTMVVKNDGCVEWAGKLHEDFKENRELVRFFIKDIERIHLSDDERMDRAKIRNVGVALYDVETNPEDPRSYWNLANSYMGAGQLDKAEDTYKTFLKLSNSDEEKYLANVNLGKIQDTLGKTKEAIETTRMAIGIRPEYPDAYFSLAQIYYNKENYREAEKHLLLGLTKRPPYYSIIVYNPREYDLAPLSLLAKTYYQLARPDQALTCLEACLKITPNDIDIKNKIKILKKEKKKFDDVMKILVKATKLKTKTSIKKLLDTVPDELKSHPGICNLRNVHFPKTESSGKDLVYYCGYTEHEWTPESARTKGIGGSEEAVIWLTQMWAKQGWNVTVYNNCGHKSFVDNGVTYKPFWEWNYRDKQDVVIVWRGPAYLKYEINAPKIFLDMHDVIPAGEFTTDRINRATKIFFKSQYQRNLYPMVPDDKVVIVPNGIDAELFSQNLDRDYNLIINTSAPNRGIYALTHMFKRIKEQHPEARLQWAYGWETFKNGFKDDPKVLAWADKLEQDMREIGVEILGRLSHGEVAKLYLKAGIWAYPSGFGEIDCISLSKAMAGGSFPVTTDFAALGEKQGHGGHFISSPLESNNWSNPRNHDFSIIDENQINASVDAIVHYLKNPPTEEDRMEMRKWAQEKFDWNNIVKIWNENLE